jgi:hypothetical protein
MTATPGFTRSFQSFDAFRIALADQEHDGRGVWGAVVRQFFLPVRRQQLVLGDFIDVVGQGQRNHVGFQAVDHSAALFAGTAVRLFDLQNVAGLGFPLFGEGGVDILVQLTGRIVGHVQQRNLCRQSRCDGGNSKNSSSNNFFGQHLIPLVVKVSRLMLSLINEN